MGLRFRRSIRLAPGLRLNLAKRGGSVSVGGGGASLNIGRDGTRGTVGLPGTGLSYRENISRRRQRGGLGAMLVGLAVIALLAWIALHALFVWR